MSSGDAEYKAWESSFLNLEVKVQYKDRYGQEHESPVVLEKYMLIMTVDEVKTGLLNLQALDFVKEQPDDLGLYLVLPAVHPSQSEIHQEMISHMRFGTYFKELGRCHSLRLKKK